MNEVHMRLHITVIHGNYRLISNGKVCIPYTSYISKLYHTLGGSLEVSAFLKKRVLKQKLSKVELFLQ